MPCDSSHLEPRWEEEQSRRACMCYEHLLHELKEPIPDWVSKGADDIYGSKDFHLDTITRLLCERIRLLSEEQMNRIIYNARHPLARKLADWWEEHLEADRRKAEDKRRMAEKEALKKSGLTKLTMDERRALGL